MITLLIIVVALLLDAVLGEPKRFHPLIGFGRLATAVERWLNRRTPARMSNSVYPLPLRERERERGAISPKFGGILAVLLMLAPPTLLAASTSLTPIEPVLDAIVLYLAIGWRSLKSHAQPIHDALTARELARAREHVGMIVSRDTAAMQETDVSKAAVESVLENGNDAIFGAIFWFLIAGAPGAVVYRLANTLDAMWGYRSERYREFGWAAARLDDVLNFVPARLTALSYALAGVFTGRMVTALRCWRDQGRRWKSPNAGPVMAAGAGSLGLALGGPAWYHGALQQRPALGAGRAPQANDIDRALKLIDRSLAIWVIALGGGTLLGYAG